MKTLSGSGPVLHHPWFFSAVALLFLSACALTPGSEDPAAPNAGAVDVGYGTVDKDVISGSVTTVESKDLPSVNSKTLAQMLARVPGVQVIGSSGGNLRVRIRGDSNSFQGGEDPLFVVDGMVAAGGIGNLNPNVIESITVLKNAGDTAIYGARGANGVILIKTKKGGE